LLTAAVVLEDIVAVRLISEYKIPFDLKDEKGQTALEIAIELDNKSLIAEVYRLSQKLERKEVICPVLFRKSSDVGVQIWN